MNNDSTEYSHCFTRRVKSIFGVEQKIYYIFVAK